MSRNHFDKLLLEWPNPRPHGGWDQLAAKISDRIERGENGTTFSELSDEKIVASPIGQNRDRGHNSQAFRVDGDTESALEESPMTTSSDQRQRDRQSLKDLAKLATSSNAQLPSTHDLSADDSGMVDLKTVAQLTGMLGGDVAKPVAPFAPPPSSSSLAFVRTESVPPAPSTQPLAATPAPASVQNFAQSIVASAPPINHTPTLISQQSPEQHAAIAYAATVPQPAYTAPAAPVTASSIAPIAIAPAEHETITLDASEVEEIRSSKKGIVIVLASLVAAAALAAGGAIFVSKIHHAPVAQKAPVVETTPVVNAVQAPVVETAPVAAAAIVPAAPAADDLTFAPADPNPALDLSSLPVANAKGAKTAPVAAKAITAKPAKAEIAKAEPKPEPKVDVKPAEPPPAPEPPKVAKASGKPDSLTDAMRTAAGPIEASKAASTESGPAFAAGTVPQKPSQGALTSALGAVLPSARSCLSPDDAVAKATIVFNSVGKVDTVSVHGGPAGKGECIKTALLKAKIQPFMDPNYTANITVRP